MVEVTVIERDPALAKLLEELPKGDPDEPKVVVWVNECDKVGIIPLNKHCSVSLGPWLGRDTHWTEIKFFYRYLRDGGSSHIEACNLEVVRYGDEFVLDVIVSRG